MQVDSDVLLSRIKADFPDQYELSLLRCLVAGYEAENARLRAELEARDREALAGLSQPETGRWAAMTSEGAGDGR